MDTLEDEHSRRDQFRTARPGDRWAFPMEPAAPPSLSSRRQAAPNLMNFTLPPFDSVHQPYQTSMAGGGGGGGPITTTAMPSAPQPPPSAMLSPQHPVSTQSQHPVSTVAPASSDPYIHSPAESTYTHSPSGSYTHSRPAPGSNYYVAAASTPQQSSFSAAYAQPSPTQPPPTTNGHVQNGHVPRMAPPAPFRTYPQYSALSSMGGSVMSNIHQPGSQMSMIHGMGVPPYGHMMYGAHQQQAPQSERPFKCDQCVQSFSRNHDLKRHKRIHLAVKPFPCTYCSKSFSRKDALKRHRLVKGCEGKSNDGGNGNGNDNGNNLTNGHNGNTPDGVDEKETVAKLPASAPRL